MLFMAPRIKIDSKFSYFGSDFLKRVIFQVCEITLFSCACVGYLKYRRFGDVLLLVVYSSCLNTFSMIYH